MTGVEGSEVTGVDGAWLTGPEVVGSDEDGVDGAELEVVLGPSTAVDAVGGGVSSVPGTEVAAVGVDGPPLSVGAGADVILNRHLHSQSKLRNGLRHHALGRMSSPSTDTETFSASSSTPNMTSAMAAISRSAPRSSPRSARVSGPLLAAARANEAETPTAVSTSPTRSIRAGLLFLDEKR